MTVLEILADEARAAAFRDLAANPEGSVRVWAERWGWTVPRVQRFLAALEKAGLATFTKGKGGSRAQLLEGVSGVSGAYRPDLRTPDTLKPPETQLTPGVSGVSGAHLDTRSLDSSRYDLTRYTSGLLEAMNAELERLHPGFFVRISQDNRGSLRASKRLYELGVDFDFARAQLLADCRRYNPSKHGRGKPPGTLGFFELGIKRAWARRSQLELGLPQIKLEQPQQQRGGEPETIAQMLERLKLAANG